MSVVNNLHNRGLVLCVEPQRQHASSIRRTLRGLGFEAICVISGDATIQALQHYQPDLILMSIALPHNDAFHITRYIRASDSLTHVPVVAMSESVSAAISETCTAVGFNDIIIKPMHRGQLLKLIMKYFEGYEPILALA